MSRRRTLATGALATGALATLALAAALGGGFATASGAQALAHVGSSATAAPRPVVLILHGRGLLGRDSAALRREWSTALERGQRALAPEPLVRDDDVRVVWYADLLDSRSEAGCTRAAPERAAAKPERDLAQVATFAGALLGGLAEMVADSESVPLRGLAGDLLYLADPARRCAVEERLVGALRDAARKHRPVVLVAHSLGSVVAYRTLRERADELGGVTIERLVTVGAPIGSEGMRELLMGGRAAARLTMPPSVRSWVNVRDPNDALAARIDSIVDAHGTSVHVRELTTTPAPTADLAHDLGRYLRDSVTARAVVGGWCEGFGRRAPAECGKE